VKAPPEPKKDPTPDDRPDAVKSAVAKSVAALDANDPAVPSLVAAVHEMCTAFGLVLNSGGDVPAEVAAKAEALDVARGAKDFATADAIRSELQADGWTVETTKSGTTVRR
jgi:cysteinyl-tRNA synthetase